MKKIIIAILILIIAILGIIVLNKYTKNKYNYDIENITNYEYYIYAENDQYGVIDKNANTIVQAEYSNVIIPNPQKDIFICYKDEKPQVINSKGEKLFTNYESVQEIKLKNVASTLTYEKNVLMYQKDGLYGLIDFNGKVITKNLYETIENLNPTEGKFLISKEGKYGVIDLKGNTLVDPEYDNVTSDEYYTDQNGYKQSGFIVSNKTEDGYKYGYINYKGKIILKTQFNEINRISKEDEKQIYLITSENGKYGLYKNTKKIIDNQYQAITYDDNINLLIIQKNKKYGAYTIDGKEIIEIEKDEITSKGIYLYVKSGNDQKVYDVNGNTIDINYNKAIYLTDNENYKISTLMNNNIIYYGIMDQNHNQLVPENYRYIEYLYKDYFIATDENGNLGVINSNGREVLPMKYSFLQRIKGKNIVQAGEQNSNITEFYSENMEQTYTATKANIDIQDDFIIVSSDEGKKYLSNNGTIISDTSKISNVNFPDQIGDYKIQQITIENIYYSKE